MCVCTERTNMHTLARTNDRNYLYNLDESANIYSMGRKYLTFMCCLLRLLAFLFVFLFSDIFIFTPSYMYFYFCIELMQNIDKTNTHTHESDTRKIKSTSVSLVTAFGFEFVCKWKGRNKNFNLINEKSCRWPPKYVLFFFCLLSALIYCLSIRKVLIRSVPFHMHSHIYICID